MGVPKFYRWISERYPNMSQVINDNQLPDFDNFYLDMNGIIHVSSHINEDNCETNVTEEEIFRNIFHFIDFLFRMIKPKKVFFMAIDGVAPRAKMNQQRARRFRAGQDRVKKLKVVAEKTNQTFKQVATKHFDTNAITPGTKFMANLNEQLKYFIHVKLNTDPLWEGVNIHLSGHLTPGEGEHKIMEYIRYTRSQPGYNVNTRHCLYGLDADLIMLGLVTHEIHFALLREEVKYGSKKISKILAPEEITWHLLHTCILRDYIDLEFCSMKNKLKISYNLDCIIDDWILMAYLVGNDFIPHLPHVHINEEALSLLWDTYKKVLPTLDGYMNESGELNLTRFDIYLTELAKFDHQRFANENDTFKYLHKLNRFKKNKSELDDDDDDAGFNLGILEKLAITSPTNQQQDSNTKSISHEQKSPHLSSSSDDNIPGGPDDDDHSSDSDTLSGKSDDDEKKKSFSKVINEDDIDSLPLIEAEFRQHKNHYYRDKMKIDFITMDQLKIYVEQYIEAIQWILKYYYQGCPSWSWFYPHHYAPYLSDLKNFKHLKILFQKGTPFKPFEQLLSVLPPTSRFLLPSILQPLMTDSDSPLLSFYPEHFQLDINEKKQDWESIVLLPFIDEQLLLNSITKYYNNLDSIDQLRNQHSPSLCFKTTSTLHPIGNSLQTNPYFPSLKETRASCTELPADFYGSDDLKIKHGRFEDQDIILFPKFPILNVLPYKFDYKGSAVNLFETRSKATTLVLNLTYRPDPDCITYNNEWNPKDEIHSQPFQITNGQLLIERYLGKRVFVNWPHFQYGIVCAISDFRQIYTWSNIPNGSYFDHQSFNNQEIQDIRNYTQTPIYLSQSSFEISNDHNRPAAYKAYSLNKNQTQMEYTKAIHINRIYESRQGISIGPIPILLYVCPLIGYRTKTSSTTDKCLTTMYFLNQALAYPLQTTLFTLPNYKSDLYDIPKTIYEYLQINDRIFALQSPYYSCLGSIEKIDRDNNGKLTVTCRMETTNMTNQPDIHKLIPKLSGSQVRYWSAQQIAEQFRTMPCVISKITGKINVIGANKRRGRANPTNVGLSWKVNKPVKQLYGYTKKIDQVWYYSDAAIAIISDYMSTFPDIIAELVRKPKDDNYFEANIWPTIKGKSELHQVRTWMKTLPTYSMALIDGAWQVLDASVIKEIDKNVKSFYAKRVAKNVTEKTKTVSLEPQYLFKASESLGMCDPDLETTFDLFDRVVIVRPGTRVPIGTRGTIVGIMLGQNSLDTYYEILFDNSSLNNLDAILFDKNQQQCRIKVRSYHLLNYTHSLRLRSMMNYQQQRSVPAGNVWEQRPFEQVSTSRQQRQPNQNFKKSSDENTSATKPKSAPASAHERPNFVHVNEKPMQSFVPMENPSMLPTSNPDLKSPTTMPLPFSPSNQKQASLFTRAINDSQQQPWSPLPLQLNNPLMSAQQSSEAVPPSQYCQNPLMTQAIENMSNVPPNLFEQQSSTFSPSQFQQAPTTYNSQHFNANQNYPSVLDGFVDAAPFIPYDLPPPGSYRSFPVEPMASQISVNYQQQQQSPMPNVHMGPPQFTPTPHMPNQSSPPQAQQNSPSRAQPITSSRPMNPSALQFVPSQVLRNIPKK